MDSERKKKTKKKLTQNVARSEVSDSRKVRNIVQDLIKKDSPAYQRAREETNANLRQTESSKASVSIHLPVGILFHMYMEGEIQKARTDGSDRKHYRYHLWSRCEC